MDMIYFVTFVYSETLHVGTVWIYLLSLVWILVMNITVYLVFPVDLLFKQLIELLTQTA